MKIALSTKGNDVYGHFGSCENFTLVDIQDGKVASKEVVGTEGNHHGSLPGYLASLGVNLVISGGMGEGAQNKLAQQGIDVITGVEGTIDETIEKYVAGTLESAPQVQKEHQCNCGCNH